MPAYPMTPSGADAPSPRPPACVQDMPEFDRRIRGALARLIGGQSPWAAAQCWEDWSFHLATSPGKRAELFWRAGEAAMALWGQSFGTGDQADWAFKPDAFDRRFRHPAWARPPFHLLAQAQLAMEAQWRAATTGVRGMEQHHARRVEFLGRSALNAAAPVNFPWSNPEVIEAALKTRGGNFVAGARLLMEDAVRLARGEKIRGIDQFRVGETVAVTPGKVVFRNALMELIQYEPATPKVRREPLLIVPAWIMRYYILDLTPPNSLVRYLVEQGFTVFIISWKNPDQSYRDTSFDDYRREGVMAALEAIGRIAPGEKIHGVGYCLGGTVLAIAAAAMDRDNELRLATLSLLAAQTDFELAGELMMFIDESQLALLEDMMAATGFLDARQMASAFYALRANELVYAKLVERYLLGEPSAPSDLDAWLTDSTRMPARMHGEYLRRLFLENSFAHGDYRVDGKAVALKDLHTPIFALGAERDHIAPWRSVYKIELYDSADTTFVLCGGGHNSSVVSPPAKSGAYYRISVNSAGGDYVDPDLWLASAPRQEGSWWPAWAAWLDRRSSAGRVSPPAMGGPLPGPFEPAPGRYVLEP
jgi:polyhydroxyalkanoate synthase